MSLQDKAIAITRSAQDATEFRDIVESEGGQAIPLPTIRLVARDDFISDVYLRHINEYNPDHTVFMSSRAVKLLFEDAAAHDISYEVSLMTANTNVVSVGPKTSHILKHYGIKVNYEPTSIYSSVGIGEVFGRIDRAGRRILVPRSGASTPFLRELLEKLGFDVRELYLYDTAPHPGGPVWESFAQRLRQGDIHGMIFTSVSSVRAFFDIMSGLDPDAASLLNKTTTIAIGPFTSSELSKHDMRYTVSPEHTVPGALDTLRTLL